MVYGVERPPVARGEEEEKPQPEGPRTPSPGLPGSDVDGFLFAPVAPYTGPHAPQGTCWPHHHDVPHGQGLKYGGSDLIVFLFPTPPPRPITDHLDSSDDDPRSGPCIITTFPTSAERSSTHPLPAIPRRALITASFPPWGGKPWPRDDAWPPLPHVPTTSPHTHFPSTPPHPTHPTHLGHIIFLLM